MASPIPPVVILAGGFGTRLAERTDELPKPMVEIGGRPILWHILKIYSHFGFHDFFIACGYKAAVIKRFFLEYRDQQSNLIIDYRQDTVDRVCRRIEPWRVNLIDTGDTTNTGGRLKRLAPLLSEGTFLMTYGDGVADVDIAQLLRFHRSHGKLATVTTVHPPSRFGLPQLDGDRVRSFEEKPNQDSEWINGGFFVLEPRVLEAISGDSASFEIEVLPKLAKDGQLMAFRHEGFWQPMDTLRDVRNLNGMWLDRPPWKVWAD